MINAIEVAARCEDAYSFDRYRNWTAVAKKLMALGLTDKQTEAVMRSKWMRWAADASNARYGRVPAQAIVDLMKHQPTREIRQLTLETFGVEQ